MLKKLKNYINHRKLKPIGTQTIKWAVGEETKHSISITFWMSDSDRRKVTFDLSGKLNEDYIKEHPWYHTWVVPFLNKTGYASYGAEYTKNLIVEMFYNIDAKAHFMAQKSPFIDDVKPDNVIIFPGSGQ